MSKLFVIFGATGKQGGSVIDSILSEKSLSSEFRLRGVTRDVSKENAKALSERGVEMVNGDLNDVASLKKAVEGAYGVFAVTDYWAKMDSPLEIQQGKNMADASLAAGVKHFVLSTLISPKKTTKGDLSKIEHFDGKAEIAEYATSIGLPSTFYLPGFYMSNLPGQMFRKDESSGKYLFALPIKADAQIPLIDIEADTGKYVKAIITNRDKLLGKEVYGAHKYYTPQEVVDAFTAAYPKDGEGAFYVEAPYEAFTGAMTGQGMPQRIADEMLENMLLLNKEYGYYAGADLTESNAILDSEPTSWADFVKRAPAWKDLE